MKLPYASKTQNIEVMAIKNVDSNQLHNIDNSDLCFRVIAYFHFSYNIYSIAQCIARHIYIELIENLTLRTLFDQQDKKLV